LSDKSEIYKSIREAEDAEDYETARQLLDQHNIPYTTAKVKVINKIDPYEDNGYPLTWREKTKGNMPRLQ